MGTMTEYTGHVDQGGPAAERELPHLVITKASVGPMDNNVYLLRCRETGEQLLIDAAADARRLLQVIGDGGLATVVTTHGDADHWQALREVLDATGARSLAHPIDAPRLPVAPEPLEEGETVRVGRCQLDVLLLPGHTPGSIGLVYRDPEGAPHFFGGDTLFPGGIGRTTNPADFDSLLTAVETKVFATLPDETWVYPGHGDDTTLGRERPHLAEWRERGW
jgi:glyoxylase-like metal-dependent hydrolase (beta-lactamase superfamily II)